MSTYVPSLTQIAGWSDEDKRTLLLAWHYEKTRKFYIPRTAKEGWNPQYGYLVFWNYGPSARETPIFKTFATVRKWLEKDGMKLSLAHSNWQGYVQHVFDALWPQVPQPGQLLNQRLLEEYLIRGPANQEMPKPARTREYLHELYEQITE